MPEWRTKCKKGHIFNINTVSKCPLCSKIDYHIPIKLQDEEKISCQKCGKMTKNKRFCSSKCYGGYLKELYERNNVPMP